MAEAETKKHRRIKPVATVRQQAEKAQQAAAVPKKKKFANVGRNLNPIFKPFRLIGKIGRYQPFPFLKKMFIFLGKIIFPTYFRNAWKELKLVTWPNWKQSRRLTYAVLIFSIVFGTLIALVDYGLGKLFRHLLIGK